MSKFLGSLGSKYFSGLYPYLDKRRQQQTCIGKSQLLLNMGNKICRVNLTFKHSILCVHYTYQFFINSYIMVRLFLQVYYLQQPDYLPNP